MRRGILACLSVFLFLSTHAESAQAGTPVIEARMVLAAEAVHPGATVKAAVVAQISAGYHINDHVPTLEYLIPTELKIEASKQLRIEKVTYPKGESKKFAFSDKALSVYEGKLVIGASLKVPKGVPPGTYTLKGQLAYQACNDHACLPPASVPVTLTVKVVRRGVPVKRVNADVFGKIQFD